ncbi:MAG: Ig-like domain-containing protein [Paludibacteraceae bacterium]|nr:Ig-like domain-containing protein [Paludibacteraceae bacterium]
MKANKFFAVALAALTLVGFNACNQNKPDTPDQEKDLALDKTSISLEVGSEEAITATIAVEWESSNPQAATVTPANDGLSAKVVAVAEGSAVITAKSKGGQTKTCVVAVKKAGSQGGEGKTIEAKRIWPIILDGTTADANASKIVADFRPNDNEKNLWVWDGSYSGGSATGANFFGNTDGYLSLVTVFDNYGGAGFNLADGSEFLAAATALRKEIVANPDNFALHMAIKSTDTQNVSYYILGCEGSYFTIGSAATSYSSNVIGDYARDGQWHEFNIELSAYATALANIVDGKEGNVFCMLAAGPAGSVLNLDAVYIYEK